MRSAETKLLTLAIHATIAMKTELTQITEASEQDRPPATVPATLTGESPLSAPHNLRVLHFFSYLGLGGTELTALRMISHLDSDLFENRLCGIRGFDPSVVALRCPRAKVVSLPGGQNPSRSQLLSLTKLIKVFQPHIVHSRNWGTIEAVPAARLAGVPVVIHSEHGYEMDTLGGLPSRRRLFRRVAYGMASAVFAVTKELQQFHAEQAWVSRSRIRVITNGIDTNLFAPRPEIRNSILQKVGVPTERFVVGSVGRLVPIKDHATLLRASERLVQRGLDVHVILAGAGPEFLRHREFLANSLPLTNRVSFVGACDNVSEVLNAMDVFVLPSISEGMSNTLIEAMASGLPVLATRVGGNPEVVGEELSISLFAPSDSNGLADRLERFARQPEMRRKLGMAARQRAVSMFGLDLMVGNYKSLYLELAEKRGLVKRMSI